jgi:hypothetical protein
VKSTFTRRLRQLILVLLFGVLVSMAGFSTAVTYAVAEWNGNFYPYSVGNVVTYQGLTYEALQSHTSQTTWTPPATLGVLWKTVSGLPTTPPTIRPTSSATVAVTVMPPPPTIRPTSSATTMPPSTGGCTSAAWDPAKIYTGGMTASHNNREWSAQWWTQGEEPGVTTSGVWKDLGACAGATPTVTPVGPPTFTPSPTVTKSPPTNTPAATLTPRPTSTATASPPPATATPIQPATAISTAAPGAPAKPSVSFQNIEGSNQFDVTWNKWWGTDGTSWQLLEDGRVIHTATVASSGGQAQSGTYRVSDKSYGAYTYQVLLINSAGVSASDPQSRIVGGASKIVIKGGSADVGKQSLQITINQGDNDFTLSMVGAASPAFSLLSNNTSVISYQLINGTTLRVRGLKAGRSSLQIKESGGETRFVGIRVRTAAGQNPGMPDYLALGSMSEDTDAHLAFWRSYAADATNKRMDIRYIYLEGGPTSGWRTRPSRLPSEGGRAISYIRESIKLGMIPYFVYYNIPDGNESYEIDKAHVQDPAYMAAYFKDLKFFLDIVRQESPDELVGVVLEPDFIGYMMQNSNGRSPTPLDQIPAAAGAAHSSGVLGSGDPTFPNSVKGTIEATNYIIHKFGPNVQFGWQFNLWASPGVTVGVPTAGIIHLTDSLGISAGRAAIAKEAAAIAAYYMSGGITSYGASFVSIDKYGLDAGAFDPANATNNPAQNRWFWNADHWNNYLVFCKQLRTSTGLPVIPWQIPVGHINLTRAVSPYPGSGGVFPALDNAVSQRGEDSAPVFFLGDTFDPGSARFSYFATNQGGDPKVSSSGGSVTWGAHMQEAKNSGIIAIFFGAGVGSSTQGVGNPPTEGYYWITKAQGYLANPVPLQ